MERRWLGAAVAQGEGLCLPGRPAGRAADLYLTGDAAFVRGAGAEARLPWEDYRLAWPRPGHRTPAAWALTHAVRGLAVDYGVGIEVGGRAVEATGAVRRATNSVRNRMSRLVDHRVVVPLHLPLGPSFADRPQRETLAALLAVLAERPAVRRRLAEPGRATRLAADMAGSRLTFRTGEPTGAGAREVFRAMVELGLHPPPGGRPIPGDEPVVVDEAVARVVDHLRRGPTGTAIGSGVVASVVGQAFRDGEPWPFAALTDAPRDRAPVDDDAPGTGHTPTWWRSDDPWETPGPGA